jgi:ABC-2 type transport system permease protein
MANKTLLVAQREYLENIRTKTFWIGILAFPLLIAISIGAGFVLNKFKQTQSYAVLDLGDAKLGERIERQARNADMEAMARLLSRSDQQLPAAFADLQREFADDLAKIRPGDLEPGKSPPAVPPELVERLHEKVAALPATEVEQFAAAAEAMATARKFQRRTLTDLGLADLSPVEQRAKLGQMVEQKQLFAFFVIGAKPTETLSDFEYVSNNFTDSSLSNWYGAAATRVVQSLRIADAKIPREVALRLKEEVRFAPKKADATGTTADVTVADKGAGFAPVAFVYLLWIAIFTAAQMLLTNTVEEKSNRIIEVLLSSVSPGELMAGKIWGIGATGLTLTVSWVLCAIGGLWLAERLIQGADLSMFASARDPLFLLSFLVYFFFGYLLYAAILVGIGSVTNSLKEAQNLLQPVFLLLIVPLVSMMFIVQEPNGTVAKVLSYIPLFTPFTMMNRASGPPELYEYVITTALLLVSVWLAFKAAGKIFRVGVLMTGNPPKLKEILGWLRHG